MQVIERKAVDTQGGTALGRPRKKETTHVRAYVEMARQIRMVAFHRGMDVADVLEQLCSKIIKREYVRVLEDIDAERRGLDAGKG